MFSKAFFLRVVKSRGWVVKSLIICIKSFPNKTYFSHVPQYKSSENTVVKGEIAATMISHDFFL